MSDLISRQAAIKYLMDNMNWYDEDGYESDEDYKRECITELINGVPSAEPVRHGKWELAEDGWYCSACELYPPFDCDPEEKGIPYCPNCGARMDKE